MVFLETQRLVLRRFTEDDAANLLALEGDPEVMRFNGPFALSDAEAYRQLIQVRFLPYYANGAGYGFWAAEAAATRDFLGWFHLRPALDYRFAAEAGFREGDYDLGYRLRRAAWGKGYATEGAQALVARALPDPAVKCVVAVALIGNAASIRVMEKVGLQKVGEFRMPGFDQSAVKYALNNSGADGP